MMAQVEEQDPPASVNNNALRLSAKEMFGDRKEIEIEYEGSIYRLRITRQGKLILNK